MNDEIREKEAVTGPALITGFGGRIVEMHALWMQSDDATLTVSVPDDVEAMFPDLRVSDEFRRAYAEMERKRT